MAFNVNTFINRMKWWCLYGNLGYDQYQRWNFFVGGEVDCSSLVIKVLQEAGQDTGGATYTGNLSANLVARGWQRIIPNGNPQPGDILLNDVHHVAVYVGNGQLAQASIDERGRASGGQTGDQSHETNVKPYYNYPWNAYLRYSGGSTPSTHATSSKPAVRDPFIFGQACTKLWQTKMGTSPDGVVSSQPPVNKQFVVNPTTFSFTSNYRGGSQVVLADQRHLKAKGYYKGNIDGWCGPSHILARAQYLSKLGFYKLGNQDNYWGEKHSEGFYNALKSGRY